ncbi:MAG: mechanosensitive ion channel domain-containing protein [Microcoleaceae cyanobacterium]
MGDIIELDQDAQRYAIELTIRLGLFLVGAVISPMIGRSLPSIIRRVFRLAEKQLHLQTTDTYEQLVQPVQNSISIAGTLIFLAICLNLLSQYKDLYTFLGIFIYLILSISIAWLASRVAQRLIRRSMVGVLQRRGSEVNEIILVFETLINLMIILFAIIIFAQGLKLNLIALTASLGISGVAVAFAAQQALSRLIGTIELYLDRPYLPGEYIRVTFNPYKEDVYGRVESIGLRSTKIRTVAKNTLIIVPNSIMAGMHVENITRGKKIMAMLCLSFSRFLNNAEQALVKQVIEATSYAFWGRRRANIQIKFSTVEPKSITQARINIFITGSSEDSINLRKRLLELAQEEVSQKLSAYNLTFTLSEPLIYVDSPMSI